MGYALSGTVKQVEELQTFASGFAKREFVVTVKDGEYSNDIKLATMKDKVRMLDGVSAGQEVHVDFDLRGNEYNGKHYVDLVAWRMDVRGAARAPASGPVGEHPEFPVEADNMPF